MWETLLIQEMNSFDSPLGVEVSSVRQCYLRHVVIALILKSNLKLLNTDGGISSDRKR